MEDDFGDFEEISENNKETSKQAQSVEAAVSRVRLPRKSEIIGVIMQRLGANRMEVLCSDGKIRNCRVPGRFKRSMWLRVKDIVLIEPWEYDNTKGDVIFKYDSASIIQLRKKGLLNSFKQEF